MISADLRRYRVARRAIARPLLQVFLHWITYYALQPLAGRALADTTASAAVAILDKIAELADRGAFTYFGIANAFELGTPPITVRQVTDDGGVVLEVEPVAEHILNGGARADGWCSAADLTVEQLER